MDFDTLSKFSKLVPSKLAQIQPSGSSFVISRFGDMFALSENGRQVTVSNLRRKSTTDDVGPRELCAVDLTFADKPPMPAFTFIEVNADGSLLILWSETAVTVVEISSACYRDGYFNQMIDGSSRACKARIIMKDQPIIKLAFHAVNKYSLVVLSEKAGLSIWDLRTYEQELFPLPRQLTFTSFTCGPSIDWLRYSIILSTKQGELYALCPVIPMGTILSLSQLSELWMWLGHHRENLPSASSNHQHTEEYLDIVQENLTKLFGDIDELLENGDDSLMLTAGQQRYLKKQPYQSATAKGSRTMRFTELSHSDYSVMLQGPISVTGQQQQQSRDAITDLCLPCPATLDDNQDGAPVIAVAYEQGQVQFLLFDGQPSPAYEPLDSSQDPVLRLRNEPVSLLVAETFVLEASGVWQLREDPLHIGIVYAIQRDGGRALQLTSPWLQAAAQVVTNALNEDEREEGGKDSYVAVGESKFSSSRQDPSANASAVIASTPPGQGQCLVLCQLPANAPIQGISILYDAFMGHVAIIQSAADQNLLALNLALHQKLFSLVEEATQRQSKRQQASQQLKQDFSRAVSDDQLCQRMMKKLAERIAQGLRRLPTMEVAVPSEAEAKKGTAHPELADGKKQLVSIAAAVEKAVLLPMQELQQNTAFHSSLVREMLMVQQELIDGQSSLSKVSASSSSSATMTLTAGLRQLLRNAEDEQKALQERISRLQEKEQQLRDSADGYLQLLAQLPRRLSRAEVAYKQQLEGWRDTVKTMQRDIETLKMQQKQRTQQASSLTVGGGDFSGSSFMAQSGQQLQLQQNPAADLSLSFGTSPVRQTQQSQLNLSLSMQRSPPPFGQKSQPSTPWSAGQGFGAGFKSPPAQQQQLALMPAPVTLTPQEVTACEDLLEELGRMLEEKKRQVDELQSKVDALKKQQGKALK